MLDLIMKILNWAAIAAMVICFSYQAVLFVASYLRKKEVSQKCDTLHKYAVLIAARNEENVLAHLIQSIQNQDYPQEMVDIYVLADNCTDATAQIARQCGAVCYERFDSVHTGKGYALDALLRRMQAEGRFGLYDGFYIFDADNLLDPSYMTQMNRAFHGGCQVVTSYRNSLNADQNWISMGYALWFLHESQFLNRGRANLGSSCMVSGTGYLVAREVIETMGGWPFHLLTEDIEFTGECILEGIPIGYCEEAVFYDEQPVTLKDSWNQRLRWVKGYFQVYKKIGRTLLEKFRLPGRKLDKFSCYDMLMTNLPAFFVMMFETLSIAGCFVAGKILGLDTSFVQISALRFVIGTYAGMFLLGVFTIWTERERLQLDGVKKWIAVVSFPLFMWSYYIIAVAALGRKVEWKQIVHRGNAFGVDRGAIFQRTM